MSLLLLLVGAIFMANGQNFPEPRNRSLSQQRCRSVDDLGRIPWLRRDSTFHNFGFPLVQSLCKLVGSSSQEQYLGCHDLKDRLWPQMSDNTVRHGPATSKIIIDPHMIHTGAPSSGVYVIMSMFGLLRELGYQPGVRHWSINLYDMFDGATGDAAWKISNAYDEFLKTGQDNPFKSSFNYISLQAEVGLNLLPETQPINTSPHGRDFRWMIGLHQANKHTLYTNNTELSHCIGANHFLGRGHLCSSSSVIPCPQYMYHTEASKQVRPDNRASLKRNVILFDGDQGDLDYLDLSRDIKLLGGVDDLQVLVHEGRTRKETTDLYAMTKITVDCRNPGVEFINYEATLYDVLTLSCNSRATRNVFDFPVPSKYHIETTEWAHLVTTLHTLLVNYTQHVDDFKHFKQLSQRSTEMALNQLDMHFFSRDVMFRTHCGTYAQCRRVFPWAVAIWTLFPLAQIEVVMDISLEQYQLDNDFILDALSQSFNSKYYKAYTREQNRERHDQRYDQHPADLFPRFPCTYMVYMDPSFVPFSRDFLNTHIAAISADPQHRQILHWHGNQLVLAVMKAKPYVTVLRESPAHRTIYVETDFQIRAIENMDTLHDIQQYAGLEIRDVGTEYLPRLPTGPDFRQSDVSKILRRSPLMPAAPCKPGAVGAGARARVVKCFTPKGLIIDALFVPETRHHRDFPVNSSSTSSSSSSSSSGAHSSAERKHGGPQPLLTEPHFWLTSSTPRIAVFTLLETFSAAEIEVIVTHMDPIIQNAQMQKIMGFIPEDTARVLRHFDAVNFPNVVSLIDAEHANWGERC